MLSKKMAFSLTSLITIFALALVVPSAMAVDFEVMIDGPKVVTYTAPAGTTAISVTLTVTSEEALPDPLVAVDTEDEDDLTDNRPGNLMLTTRDMRGFEVSGIPTSATAVSAGTDTAAAAIDGVTVTETDVGTFAGRSVKLRQLVVSIIPRAAPTTLEQVTIAIPAFETPDARVDNAHDWSLGASHTILIRDAADVALDEDDAQVVSIQRLRPGSQTAVAAFQDEEISPDPFDIRVVLTESRFSRIDYIDKTPDELAKELIEVDGGEVSDLRRGVPFEIRRTAPADAGTTFKPHPNEGRYDTDVVGALPGLPPTTDVPMPTGLDNMYHEYRVTVTPQRRQGPYTLTLSVKGFGSYSPFLIGEKPNGRDQLRVPVKEDPRDRTAGIRIIVGHDIVVPKNGYLIIATDWWQSQIVIPRGRIDKSPRAIDRQPAQMIYNLIDHGGLPNLATQFYNGVVIDVESSNDLVISEVMWGEDASLTEPARSQWIELYNPGDEFKTPEDDAATYDIDERLTLVIYRANEFSDIPAKVAVAATATAPATMALPDRVTDRIGTLDATGKYWSPATKGQSGRSGLPIQRFEERFVDVEIIPTIGTGDVTPIVSMYRGMEPDTSTDAAVGAMKPVDGQMAASWMSSQEPRSANFRPHAIGLRHGTPGAPTDATDTPADTEAEAKAKADEEKADADKIAGTGTIPKAGQIYISEVMFAGGGTLPQWIEISNGSRAEEVNLSGWTITVDNAAADADVSIGASATFTIPKGTTIDMSGQDDTPSTILVVTEKGRNSFSGPKAASQVIVLDEPGSMTEIDLILAGVTKGKYTLLSGMAFQITLAPPEPGVDETAAEKTARLTAEKAETVAAKTTRQATEARAAAERKKATDTVGNLGADGAAAWVLPMSEEGGRSSIIRRHVQVARGPSAPEDGTMMDNWVLASDTSFAQVTHIRAQSFYGAANDVGTPGFRPGGALPVELSHFRPARNKETGAVVITWSTQSELNNAGFFIKRSNQPDSEFKIINAAMIPGAGTISEKQFYTFTDTTAQPNVVYYYQIEDVSLDGNRQQLTRGIRLKGHVSVAGKATLTWGELKTSHE